MLRRKRVNTLVLILDSGAVRETLHLIQKIFLLARREDTVYANRTRPCLMYQIGRCAAPCVSSIISDEEYSELYRLRSFVPSREVDKLRLETLIDKMTRQVESFALNKLLLSAIKSKRFDVQEQQYVSDDSTEDMDVLGLLKRTALLVSISWWSAKVKFFGQSKPFP